MARRDEMVTAVVLDGRVLQILDMTARVSYEAREYDASGYLR
jgi:hypothetical protein